MLYFNFTDYSLKLAIKAPKVIFYPITTGYYLTTKGINAYIKYIPINNNSCLENNDPIKDFVEVGLKITGRLFGSFTGALIMFKIFPFQIPAILLHDILVYNEIIAEDSLMDSLENIGLPIKETWEYNKMVLASIDSYFIDNFSS